MFSNNLHLLPLTVFILFPLTFITTFCIALSKDHIHAFFSYISDTGTTAPELCYFSQFLNICAFFLLAVAYVRYKQVEEVLRVKKTTTEKLTKINKIGLFFGIVAGVGTSVVACFQESNILLMHVVGAFMSFMGGSIYLTFQGYLTLHTAPISGSRGLGIFRIFIGVTCGILFVVSYTTGTISITQFTGDNFLKWKPEDGAWTLRVISTTTEWIMAALLDLYFLTFVPEFRKLALESPQLRIVEHSTIHQTKNGSTNHEKVLMHQVRQDEL